VVRGIFCRVKEETDALPDSSSFRLYGLTPVEGCGGVWKTGRVYPVNED